jgi:DNA-binding Lrp family transcriptional regulator
MKNTVEFGGVDKEDLKILSCLRKNARETLTRISKLTGIPISSTFDRLKRLEAIGVITRHTSLVDLKKIGFTVRVFLLLKTNANHRKEVERFLMENLQANNVARITGNWNFVMDALFRDVEELESFIEALRKDYKGIEFSLHHVLETLKQECFLIDQNNPENGRIK